jgi:hypothetical protein
MQKATSLSAACLEQFGQEFMATMPREIRGMIYNYFIPPLQDSALHRDVYTYLVAFRSRCTEPGVISNCPTSCVQLSTQIWRGS